MADDTIVRHDENSQHDWVKKHHYMSTGPNILGNIVTCLGWDVECECGEKSWIRDNNIMKR